jgi:Raf kinase inhibitor-like YbhB/YbcL family protein
MLRGRRVTLLVAAGMLVAGCAGPGTTVAPGTAASATAGPATPVPVSSASASVSTSTPGSPEPSPATPAPAGSGPAQAAPTPTASGPATPARFVLTSTGFDPGGAIPSRFTCDGEDVSPPLAWSGAPAGTAALVLVVDDPDAAGFVHWTAYNLDAGAAGLPRGVTTAPGAPPQGSNDFGRPGWGGPCPPSGTHRYRFRLRALDAPLPLTGFPTPDEVRRALAKATVLGTATLEGSYARR